MNTQNNITSASGGWHDPEGSKKPSPKGSFNDHQQSDRNQQPDQFNQKPSEPMLIDRAMSAIKNMANFSSLLRIFGAIAVLASMSMFLMQGWEDTGDFQRFCMMIAQTFLLGAGGFAMIKLLKEKKGSRLFFGLSLVSITVNFTILGALIYSVFPLNGLAEGYADFALWQADSAMAVLLSVAISFVVLIPVSLLAFSMLARPAAKKLTLWYGLMNALLLLPIREVSIIMLIIGVATIALSQLFLSKKNRLIDSTMFTWKTQEGRYARLILFVPLIIMFIRSIWQYDFGNMAQLMTLASVYAVSVFIAKILEYKIAIWGYLVAWFAALCAALLVVGDFNLLPNTSDLLMPLFALIFGALSIDLYIRSAGTWAQGVIKILSASFIATALAANQLDHSSVVSVFSALFFAAATLFAGIKLADKFLIGVALCLGLLITALHAGGMIDFVISSGWIGFAIGGVSVIVFASLLDRYGAIVKLKLFPPTAS